MNKKILIAAAAVALAAVVGGVLWLAGTSPAVQFEKGRKAMLTGKLDEAEEYLAKVVAGAGDNEALGAEAMLNLGKCRMQRGDTVGAMGYMRDAALYGNREAHACYAGYLDADPEKGEEYMSYYTALNERWPDNSTYAARLARAHIYDTRYRDFDKAAELLQPFVTRTGGIRTSDVNAMAYAGLFMSMGAGGYAQSPEGASVIAMKCRSLLKGRLDDPDIDGFALEYLAGAELINKVYNSEDKVLENIGRALAYMRAAQKKEAALRSERYDIIVRWLEDVLDEAEKVQHSPHWWDRKPADWTAYSNETGFRYVGHTNLSGLVQSWGNNEYPTGWGCGVWTKDEPCAFIGKWNQGRMGQGLFINAIGQVSVR